MLVVLFSLTTLVSAFLLFWVQPLIAKLLLCGFARLPLRFAFAFTLEGIAARTRLRRLDG